MLPYLSNRSLSYCLPLYQQYTFLSCINAVCLSQCFSFFFLSPTQKQYCRQYLNMHTNIAVNTSIQLSTYMLVLKTISPTHTHTFTCKQLSGYPTVIHCHCLSGSMGTIVNNTVRFAFSDQRHLCIAALFLAFFFFF